MTFQQNPNIAVWQTAKEYLEAAEILLDYNRIRPAAVLAALSLELCLKSFSARRIRPWIATTVRGHSLVALFDELPLVDRKALLDVSMRVDASTNLEQEIAKFDKHFERGRYLHEPDVPNSVGSDIIYFARHLYKVVQAIAEGRSTCAN